MHTRFAILHLASQLARPDESIEFERLPMAAALALASTRSPERVGALVRRLPTDSFALEAAHEWVGAGMTEEATADLMSALSMYGHIAELQSAVEPFAPTRAPARPQAATPAPASFWEQIRNIVPEPPNRELDLQWAAWRAVVELSRHPDLADVHSMHFRECAEHAAPWSSLGHDCASLFDSITLVLNDADAVREAWVGACVRASMVIEPLTIVVAYRQTVRQMPMHWDPLAASFVKSLGTNPATIDLQLRARRDLAAIPAWFAARLAQT